MVLVSHRLSFLTDCDHIIVMDGGKLIDMAPHEVLLERCAIYRHLWTQQNGHLRRRGGEAAEVPRLALGD